MTDNAVFGIGLFLILIEKFLCAGKSNLCDILFDFFLGHADTVIGNRDRLCLSIEGDVNAGGSAVILGFTDLAQAAVLLDSIAGIGDYFTDKNILVGIEPFFDDRKQIFRINCNLTFSFHVGIPPSGNDNIYGKVLFRILHGHTAFQPLLIRH